MRTHGTGKATTVSMTTPFDRAGVRPRPCGFIVGGADDGDDIIAGYAIARLQNGEFGDDRLIAPIDTIGGRPDAGHRGVATALLSQLLANLDALHVERLRTTVSWDNFALLGFLAHSGFAPAQQLVLTRPIEAVPGAAVA